MAARFGITFVATIVATLVRRLRFLDKVVSEFPNNFKGEDQYKLVVTAFEQALADYRLAANLPTVQVVEPKVMYNEHFSWEEVLACGTQSKIATIKLIRERVQNHKAFIIGIPAYPEI